MDTKWRWRFPAKMSGRGKAKSKFHKTITGATGAIYSRCRARSFVWKPIYGKKSDYAEEAFCKKCGEKP